MGKDGAANWVVVEVLMPNQSEVMAVVSFGGDEMVHQACRGSIVMDESGEVSLAPTILVDFDDPDAVAAV